MKSEHKTWIGEVWILLKHNFEIFREGVIPPKKLILGFGGTLPVRALQSWPLGLRRISALHLIGQGPEMFESLWRFSYDFPFSIYRRAKSPITSGTSRNADTFPLPLVGSLQIDYITKTHMHHLEGNASPAGRLFVAQCHRILWSSVPSAVPNVTLIRESCRPAGRKRLFIYIFWGPYTTKY